MLKRTIYWMIAMFWSLQVSGQQEAFTLSASIKAASEKSPLLVPFRLDTAMARADITSAALRPNPVLNNQSLFLSSPSHFPANTHFGNDRNRQIWWQLTKDFELPSQRRSRIELAKQNAGYSGAGYQEIARNVFREVSFQWLEVWAAQKQVDIYRLASVNADSLNMINELRYQKQAITETELLRTRLARDQYRMQLDIAAQALKSSVLKLQFITGDANVSGVDTSGFAALGTFGTEDSLLNFGLSSRADVRMLSSMVAVSDANISYQRSKMFPTPELGVIYNPQNSVPYVGIYGTIELPFFSRNQGEIEKSVIRKKQAEEMLEAGKLRVRNELDIAYGTYLMYRQKLADYRSQLKTADQVLANVRYSYLRGGTTIIDYLEAQRNWLEVQQVYFDTYRSFKETGIDLLFISGKIIELGI